MQCRLNVVYPISLDSLLDANRFNSSKATAAARQQRWRRRSGNARNVIVANLSTLVISSKRTMCNFVPVRVVTTIPDYS